MPVPCFPLSPGMGLESRLAPGGLGTLPCPAGYSGHSRAACRLSLVQEGLPGLSLPSSPQVHYGCSPAQGPGKREGILGGALGPQPSQPRILALKGMFDTEGAARPALDLDLDLATAWAAVILGLDQGQDRSCGRGRQPSQGSYMPGEKVGLNRQLGKTLCSPVFPPGLPQPPDSGKRKRAPSVCPPARPSPSPTSATVPQLFQASPCIPPHDPGAFPLSAPPSPLWATAGPPSWSWPVLGEGLHLGAPSRTPLSELQPSSFHSPLPAQLGTVCSPPSRGQWSGIWATAYGG